MSGALIAAFAVILGLRTFSLPHWMLRLFAHHPHSVAILVSILAAAFFISITLTALVVSAYILLQSAILVRREGVSGVAGWVSEITRRFNARWQNGFSPTPSDTLSDSMSNSGDILQDTNIRSPGIRDNSSKSTMISKSGNDSND